MINAVTWGPAFTLARSQSRTARFDAGMRGMTGVIDDFFTESQRFWANRTADGLRPIDTAARAVRNGWVGWGGMAGAADAAVTTLLNACAAWLANRRVFGMRITGWREPHIQRLYWQVAWSYSCENYARQALLRINANIAGGNATLTTDPVGFAAPEGNPYSFPNSGYTHTAIAPQRALRGDSRDPEAIRVANGFQPTNLGTPAQYRPWFDGNAVGDTISVTGDAGLAIDAGPAAHALGYRIGAGPAWLAGERVRLDVGPVRGYVYEFSTAGNQSTRLLEAPQGVEHIFLSLPANTIINWWFVLPDRTTVGPYPFPAPAAAPGVPLGPDMPAAPGVPATVSGARRTLA